MFSLTPFHDLSPFPCTRLLEHLIRLEEEPRALERRSKLAVALIMDRVIDPASKLATARALDATTALHSLGATLGLGSVRAKEVYATLD